MAVYTQPSAISHQPSYNYVESADDIKDRLLFFRECFPDLISRVNNIDAYSQKLSSNARVVCQYLCGECTGFAAYYSNDRNTFTGYITLIGIMPGFRRRGLGRKLLHYAIEDMQNSGMKRVKLEVMKNNAAAINLYESDGFSVESESSPERFYMFRDFMPHLQNQKYSS